MTLETILRTVLHAAAWSAFVVFCGVVAGVGVRWMLRMLCHARAETGRRCGRWAAMTLASLALVCGVVAQKANTNAPPNGVSASMMQRAGVAATPSSSQGGGCDGEGTAATSGCDGEGARPCGLPSEAELLRRISATPESKLWYAATPSNSLLVTWVNGLLDRNPLTPTNFQAEFFPDGSYEYRYPDHRESHPFTLPFDRDGDGLENTVDPEPETAGPDAHNTNAEWYNVVCSNVFTMVDGMSGMGLAFRNGVNSNAYYFVDVCAEMGPAPIYFTADQKGRLGSPVVVATAGVTNRVPLLIGATYSVTSSVPFSVAVPADGFAEVTTNAANEYVVNWPVRFDFRESLGASGRSYTVYA